MATLRQQDVEEQDELEGRQHHGVTEEERRLPGKIPNGTNGIGLQSWQSCHVRLLPEVHELQQVLGAEQWRCSWS